MTLPSVNCGHHVPITRRYKLFDMAERVGFEPTCPLQDKTLSRRPRYDHFGTSPSESDRVERTFHYTVRSATSKTQVRLAPFARSALQSAPTPKPRDGGEQLAPKRCK